MRLFISIYFLSCFFTLASLAQENSFVLKASVFDANTGDKLVGASVFEAISLKGASADENGFCEFSLPKGKHIIGFSFVGYETVYKTVELFNDIDISVALDDNLKLKSVDVFGSKTRLALESAQVSKISFEARDIKLLPSFMGEADIIKSFQLMPGVQAGGDGSRVYVRGGGADQNLLLLDDVPLYNASHLFGFFSIFNSDAIDKVDMYTGGFPSRFGGRLSSVIDIKLKSARRDSIKGGYSFGLLSSKTYMEIPLFNNNASCFISTRGAYTDPVSKTLVNVQDYSALKYRFFDINSKFTYFFPSSKLSFAFYKGQDFASGRKNFNEFTRDYITNKEIVFDIDEANKMNWGNSLFSLSWAADMSDVFKFKSSLSYTRYNFDVWLESIRSNTNIDNKSSRSFDYSSGINDFTASIDMEYLSSDFSYLTFGLSFVNHSFEPGVNVIQVGTSDASENMLNTFSNEAIKAREYAVYLQDELSFWEIFKCNAGLRYSAFATTNALYESIEPRISMRMAISDKFSIKGAYSRMQQYIHLLSNSTLAMPSDLWLPATSKIRPMIARQYAISSLYDFPLCSFSTELFYKQMDNIIEYKEGASFFGSSKSWEDKVEIGKGWSYGIEFLIRRSVGNTTGWIGYTWSKSDRLFENINLGKTFPAKFDRRHDFSFVLSHKFSNSWDFGLTWVYGSGDAVTLSNQVFAISSPSYSSSKEISKSFESRNNYRVPDYHRLDVGLNYHKKTKYGNRTWNFSIFNAYNRQNALHLFAASSKQDDGSYKTVLKQVSLFTIMPSLSYIFNF